jgi:hypothetical protein
MKYESMWLHLCRYMLSIYRPKHCDGSSRDVYIVSYWSRFVLH